MCIAVHTVNKNTKKKNSQSMEESNTLAVLFLFMIQFFLLRKKKAIVAAIEEIPPVTNSGSTIKSSLFWLLPNWRLFVFLFLCCSSLRLVPVLVAAPVLLVVR